MRRNVMHKIGRSCDGVRVERVRATLSQNNDENLVAAALFVVDFRVSEESTNHEHLHEPSGHHDDGEDCGPEVHLVEDAVEEQFVASFARATHVHHEEDLLDTDVHRIDEVLPIANKRKIIKILEMRDHRVQTPSERKI